MFSMKDCHCFLFSAAFFLLLFFHQLDARLPEPFYLVPVYALSGSTIKTSECIGTLISPRHIISPAHCFFFKYPSYSKPLTVATGVFIDYRTTKEYPKDRIRFPVDSMFFSNNISIHPNFDIDTLKNDVAIVEESFLKLLSKSFSMDNSFNIAPINISGNINHNDFYSVAYYQRKENLVEGVISSTQIDDDNIAKHLPNKTKLGSPAMVYHMTSAISANLHGMINAITPRGDGKFVNFWEYCDWIQNIANKACLEFMNS